MAGGGRELCAGAEGARRPSGEKQHGADGTATRPRLPARPAVDSGAGGVYPRAAADCRRRIRDRTDERHAAEFVETLSAKSGCVARISRMVPERERNHRGTEMHRGSQRKAEKRVQRPGVFAPRDHLKSTARSLKPTACHFVV